MTQPAPVAVVTGGTAGIGRATVRAFADAGFDVAVLARGEAGLLAAAAEVEERGRRGLAVATDVADADAVDAAVFGPAGATSSRSATSSTDRASPIWRPTRPGSWCGTWRSGCPPGSTSERFLG